jgi:hypothetical protein
VSLTDLTAPIITDTGTRISGLRFADTRVHALLQALLVHRLLPHGFTNRDLRTLIAPLLGTTTEHITAGKMSPEAPAQTAVHLNAPPATTPAEGTGCDQICDQDAARGRGHSRMEVRRVRCQRAGQADDDRTD